MPTIDPRVDAYIAKAAPFARPILTEIRAAFHAGCPDLTETIKWGTPSFEKDGMLGGMSAFKRHVGFGFWKGKLMKDTHGLLGDDPAASPMHVKVTTPQELPARKVLVSYVKQAVRLNAEGAQLPRSRARKSAPKAPRILMDALRANAAALAVWEGFTPGRQREYVEWITEAKREATRDKRLAQAVEWIAEGKSRNWKYESC